MLSFIRISNEWSDNDVLQLRFEVCDGESTFINSAYASLDWFRNVAGALEGFGKQVYGGLYDMEAGTPGPEFADGAFVGRFHWFKPTELFISTRQQSDFFTFKDNRVAREATLFLRTEPALLDRFIVELRAAHDQRQPQATLGCVPLHGA
jgi:hypothetical protein